MSDQRQMWNQKHAEGVHHKYGLNTPRKFATEVVNDMTLGDAVLELGCGIGADARYFAEQGMIVTATDFSDVVISENNAMQPAPNLKFEVLDLSDTFPYKAETFDAVYAHLAIHYFDDTTTSKLVAEVARVLKPNGKFYFVCKSTDDLIYGEGTLIGPDTFERDGHIRHFFSPAYTKKLLESSHLAVKLLKETAGVYGNKESAFIECWAAKAGES